MNFELNLVKDKKVIIEFLKMTLPLVLIAVMFLIALMIKGKKEEFNFEVEDVKIQNKKNIIIFSILFLIILFSVFHLIDYRITFIITLITVLSSRRELFKRVDYSLLLTFIAFFIFIGNISSLDIVKDFMEGILSSGKSTFISSIVVSQIISNVPATMLISVFAPYYNELLLGVNIGGLGTLIASLASVISYKLYIKEHPEEGISYMNKFTIYNVLGLITIIPIIYFLI